MTAPIPQTAFRGPGDNLIGGVLAHLRLADRLPIRISCRCRAHWDDPALAQLCFEREVDLGTFGDLVAAMIVARKAVASGQIDAGRDPALRLAPQFITILDAEHCLVLAGDVQAGLIRWCAPVDSVNGGVKPGHCGGAKVGQFGSVSLLGEGARRHGARAHHGAGACHGAWPSGQSS